jgi:hypothetical protein
MSSELCAFATNSAGAPRGGSSSEPVTSTRTRASAKDTRSQSSASDTCTHRRARSASRTAGWHSAMSASVGRDASNVVVPSSTANGEALGFAAAGGSAPAGAQADGVGGERRVREVRGVAAEGFRRGVVARRVVVARTGVVPSRAVLAPRGAAARKATRPIAIMDGRVSCKQALVARISCN